MIALDDLLNIICTEASEEGWIGEVPARKDNAREISQQGPVLQYDLELIKAPDGTLQWVE